MSKHFTEFALIVYDGEERKYYVHRPDCPGEEWKEITLGAVVDLGGQLRRYEQDAWNEKHKRI